MLKRYSHPPARVAAVRAEYRIRKRKHHRLALALVPYALVVLTWVDLTESNVLALLLVGGWFALGMADWRVWRCPNCERWLRRTLWWDFCPHCNIPLERAPADDHPLP